MSAATIPADPTPRLVRIIVDGTATPLGLSSDLLRVQYAGGVLLVDPEVDGVEVEDRTAPRTWTDGDVVQHPTAGWTLTRDHGSWCHSRATVARDYWTDAMVTDHVDGASGEAPGWDGPLVVLRYQAGEQ